MDYLPVCRCVWRGECCIDPATEEDGMCDWCAPRGCADTTGGHVDGPDSCWQDAEMTYA